MVGLVCAALLAAAETDAKAPVFGVAVLDVQTEGPGITPQASNALGAALAAEINKLKGARVTTTADLRDLIGLERQKSLLGCSEDQSCIAELAGALAADELLSTRVVAVDRQQTVTMSRLNVRTAAVVRRATRTVDKSRGEELLALVGPMVTELYPDAPLREGRTRGIDTATLRQLIPPPLPKWPALTAGAAAAAAAIAGLAVGLQSRGTEAEYNRLAAQSEATAVDGQLLKSLEGRVYREAQAANGLFIAAGALAVTAAVLAFFTDWSGGPTLSLGPTPTGVAAALSVRF